MEIKYQIDKSQRKAMAQAISDLIDETVQYLGAPTFAYQIGFFTLTQECILQFSDCSDSEIVEMVLESLEEGYCSEPVTEKPTVLTISIPKTEFNKTALENLYRITENKAHLLKHAFETESLEITETDETIEFPWFTLSSPEDSSAYQQFISMLCNFAKNQKRVNSKPDTNDNEKYAFRCFLLRLGMIGSEYKSARKVLLRNLTGSSAFRHGDRRKSSEDKPKGETDHEVSE